MKFATFILGILVVFICGCAGTVARPRPTVGGLNERAGKILPPPGEALCLDTCIELALEYNLELELSSCRTRLRELDRDAALSFFLPRIELQVSRFGTDNPRLLRSAGGLVQMSDQHITHSGISLQQGIFVPQSWLLYSMFKQGVEIEKLLGQRLRQLIALQISARYYACLYFDSTIPALERGVEEAVAIKAETWALAEAGIIMHSDAEAAALLLQSRELTLAYNHRARREAYAELLRLLGVSPLAEIELQPSEPAATVTASEPMPGTGYLPELVSEALEARLELQVADKAIELQRNEVRRAVAAFLPNIGLSGDFLHSSDSFLRYASVWSYGLGGVLTVFDGFRNLNEYRAARVRHEQAYIEREQHALSIIIEVLGAEHRRQQAAAAAELARARLRLLDEVLREKTALRREGLLTAAALLGDLTRRDEAAAALQAAEYSQLLALAAWRDVLGRRRAREPDETSAADSAITVQTSTAPPL